MLLRRKHDMSELAIIGQRSKPWVVDIQAPDRKDFLWRPSHPINPAQFGGDHLQSLRWPSWFIKIVHKGFMDQIFPIKVTWSSVWLICSFPVALFFHSLGDFICLRSCSTSVLPPRHNPLKIYLGAYLFPALSHNPKAKREIRIMRIPENPK